LRITYEDTTEGACAGYFKLVQRMFDDLDPDLDGNPFLTGYNFDEFQTLISISYEVTKTYRKINNSTFEIPAPIDME